MCIRDRTDSRASAEDIGRRLHIPAARLRVVYLAAAPHFRPVREEGQLAAVRGRYHLPATFILYLGGFDPRKNVPGLLRAYARLARRRPDAPPLVIAGRPPARPSAFFSDPRQEARAAGVAERVHCIGWVAEEDKPALYSLATCFVFPSFYEGFGLPVLEAMACGTPVVTSCGSALAELAGEAGLLVPPAAEEQIAGALETLVFEGATRARLAEAGLARAARFTWEETARRTRAAYTEALARRRPSGFDAQEAMP